MMVLEVVLGIVYHYQLVYSPLTVAINKPHISLVVMNIEDPSETINWLGLPA